MRRGPNQDLGLDVHGMAWANLARTDGVWTRVESGAFQFSVGLSYKSVRRSPETFRGGW